jgi:hypothetical protein
MPSVEASANVLAERERRVGLTSFALSAVAVAMTGSRIRDTDARCIPSATRQRRRGATFASSSHTRRRSMPTARSTATSAVRASNAVVSRLNAIRNAATSPRSPTARRSMWVDCITRWRSIFRCAGVSTASPAGSAARSPSATRATSASRRTTTSTRFTSPGRVTPPRGRDVHDGERAALTRATLRGEEPRTVNRRRRVGPM